MFLAASLAAGFSVVTSDARIDTRVDPRIRGAVAAIYDSLAREGIGAEPLIQYASRHPEAWQPGRDPRRRAPLGQRPPPGAAVTGT
jgi:hypothetical protein